MQSLKTFLRFLNGLYYALPVQLLLEQFKNRKTLLAFWLFLFLVVSGDIMSDFGATYVLLEPEYNQHVNFFSTLFLGTALGIFMLAYQMTLYILDGYKFYFLSLEKQPFLKFRLNNLLIPTAFTIYYTIKFWELRLQQPGVTQPEVIGEILGILAGILLVSTASTIYFLLTNRNLVKFLGQQVLGDIGNSRIILREARRSLGLTSRVDYFLAAPWKIHRVPNAINADFRYVVRIMNQQHSNALFAEAVLLFMLFLFWLFQDYERFTMPSGASFLVLFAFIIMIVGAITFWLRRFGPFIAVLVVGGFLFLNQYEPFVGRYMAFGMDYGKAPVAYNRQALADQAQPERVRQDSLQTIRMLERWQQDYYEQYGRDRKPRLVLLAVSGGGTRSAYWVMNCLQRADSALQGKLLQNVRLITGASGGMIGASYMRELMWMAQQPGVPDSLIYSPRFRKRASQDLLNPIIFSMTANLFFPNHRFRMQGQTYIEDRGYAFEEELIQNTGAFQGRLLGDYQRPVREARLPMMILSPTIVNDGRPLYISSQDVTYMAQPARFSPAYSNAVPGVAFRHMFRKHNADSLRFTTAIRMNATFPYVLPAIELPTQPRTKVMDAGVVDNFGAFTAVKFLYYFRHWVQRNTRGVVLLQIRDTQREDPIQPAASETILGRLFSVFGTTYSSLAQGKDIKNDDLYQYTRAWMDTPFEVLELQYIPDRSQRRGASLNFHLTEREKRDLRQAYCKPANQRVLKRLRQLLAE